MTYMTEEQRRERMDSINSAEKGNREYGRRIRIHDYVPGVAIWNFDEASAKKSPTGDDFEVLQNFKKVGGEMIIFSLQDEQEVTLLQGLLELCHCLKIKSVLHLQNKECFPCDAEWKEQYFLKVKKWMDCVGFEGVCDCISGSEPDEEKLPIIEDFLEVMYTEHRNRDGFYIVWQKDEIGVLQDRKTCDYVWVDKDTLDSKIGYGKDFANFVLPDIYHGTSIFAKTIPFMQFPLLTLGDSKNKDVYEEWKQYLRLYKPMVEENSLVYMDIRDSEEILSELPKDVYATMFVNQKKYLVVSNFTNESYDLQLSAMWTERMGGQMSKHFEIKPNTMILLQKAVD